MSSLNAVHLIGNLTRDPEIRYTPKGVAIASLSIAVNEHWTSDTGEKKERVTFIEMEAFGRLAEIIGEFCKKGQCHYFGGKLKQDTWNDKTTGEKRSKMMVNVTDLQLLSNGKRADSKPQEETTRPSSGDDDPPF